MVHTSEIRIPAFLVSFLIPSIFLLFFNCGNGSAVKVVVESNQNLTNFNFTLTGHILFAEVESRKEVFNPSSSPSVDIDRKSSEQVISNAHLHVLIRNASTHSENYDGSSSNMSIYDDKFIIRTQLVIRLAQCRASCVDKFGVGENLTSLHRLLGAESSISTCWRTCHLLEEGRTGPVGNGTQKAENVLCSLNSQLCLSGCQEACGFHLHQQENILQSSLSPNGAKDGESGTGFFPVTAIPVKPVLSISSEAEDAPSFLIQWPTTDFLHNDQHLVYTLVQPQHASSSTTSWEVVGEQTIANEMTIPGAGNPSALRVLAVNSHGLAQVFSYQSESHYKEPPTEIESDSWHLGLYSLVHQQFLVVTEVRWEFPQGLTSPQPHHSAPTPPEDGRQAENVLPTSKLKHGGNDGDGFRKEKEISSLPKPGRNQLAGVDRADRNSEKRPNFLLTWEVYGGLVRGHLVTEMNVVTISLWPDTSYVLQVGVIDERQLRLRKGESSITQMESLLSSGSELPVRMRSNTLSINTSLAAYPLVKKSTQGEWKRSAEELIPNVLGPPMEINSTRPAEKLGGESPRPRSSPFCNWKVHQHPLPTQDELRACILIWGILIVCLIIIFLMFLYFSVAVYVAMRNQIYFQKLHTSCSVSSIYTRQFYRLRRNMFRKHGHRPKTTNGQQMGSSGVELLPFSDSSNSSGSED